VRKISVPLGMIHSMKRPFLRFSGDDLTPLSSESNSDLVETTGLVW
jgi:hypothetical protein